MTSTPEARFKGLGLRIISALVLVTPVLAAVWAGAFPFLVLVALAGALMAIEWVQLVGATRAQGIVLAVVMVAILGAQFIYGLTLALAIFALLLLAALAISAIRRSRYLPWAGGLLYVAPPLVSAQWLREDLMGGFIILFLCAVVWGTDIFAMFVGKTLQGPKLAPVLSPNKTWSGLLGGMAGAVILGAVVLGLYVMLGDEPDASAISLLHMALIAMAGAVIAQMGDLFESGLKRHFGVKDSGHIIPGHGGLLDRVDGLVSVFTLAAIVIALGHYYGGLSPLAVLWGQG